MIKLEKLFLFSSHWKIKARKRRRSKEVARGRGKDASERLKM